ncbi:hypothetical protein N2605_26860 [Bradyrhizobium yuanmingense]|nr:MULTISPECIES: hypothetical protein [unclassified Bradyrhizobium]MCK1733958.1 hypothetical protein [Bradyrhizobium sp. 138]UWU83147.1 hypothetical protein N2605_26860 [Bradyrhizobium sp. CB1024]WOH59908.1 hypothetical protein RX329_07225 [Bradyrhizobium sp. BWC-3-1]
MNWLLCWKVVLAASMTIVAINAGMMVFETARGVYHEWKTPRDNVGK